MAKKIDITYKSYPSNVEISATADMGEGNIASATKRLDTTSYYIVDNDDWDMSKSVLSRSELDELETEYMSTIDADNAWQEEIDDALHALRSLLEEQGAKINDRDWQIASEKMEATPLPISNYRNTVELGHIFPNSYFGIRLRSKGKLMPPKSIKMGKIPSSNPSGWHREPINHGLAAKGIKVGKGRAKR